MCLGNTARRVFSLLALLVLFIATAMMIASPRDSLRSITDLVRGFSNGTFAGFSALGFHEMLNGQSPLPKEGEFEDKFERYRDKADQERAQEADLLRQSRHSREAFLFDLLLIADTDQIRSAIVDLLPPGDLEEVEAEQTKYFSWTDFLFDLLQSVDTNDNNGLDLLDPIVFSRTGGNYRTCATECYFDNPSLSAIQVFPDDPRPPLQYCNTCHTLLTQLVKHKAESLLEGVSREAALDGCWDIDGILHQNGEQFTTDGCNMCFCGGGGTAAACLKMLLPCDRWD